MRRDPVYAHRGKVYGAQMSNPKTLDIVLAIMRGKLPQSAVDKQTFKAWKKLIRSEISAKDYSKILAEGKANRVPRPQ
jgi:hypothetical protein